MRDIEAFAKVTAGLVREATAPLIRRIAALEAVAPVHGEPGPAGKDGRDGKDAEPWTEEHISAAVFRYFAEHPPVDGRDGVDGKDGRDGVDGKDAEPWTEAQFTDAVGRHLTLNPPPPGKDGLHGKDGKDGADGVGLADALIDREGVLILTMTDGRTKALSTVIGRDGINGKDGSDGANGTDGRDGTDGEPGPTGLGFDDMDLSLADDGRTVVFSFERGEMRQSFEIGFPVVVDRGVYKAEAEYEKGDGVTWAGSYWIAQEATKAKPGDGPGWRLAVKKGRDGKDGTPGQKGLDGTNGKDGKPGRDAQSWS